MDLSNIIKGVTEIALYTSIRDYIYARIELLTETILAQNLSLVLLVITSLLTIWVMVQGFLIVTGRSQENLKGFLFNLGKTYLIVVMALGVASSHKFSVRVLTDGFADGVSEIMTGNAKSGSMCLTKKSEDFVGCKIDQNLTTTQGIMAFMNSVDDADDTSIKEDLERAKLFAGAGSAGPAVVAGTMLIMYRIAMSLFIGFGPIFILCLLSKKTAPLFTKWLHYGLATIFSSVLLAVMSDISLDLTKDVAESLFVTDKLLSLVGSGSSGLMQAATQQLGLGLILSTLLIVVPPMAGAWFNGVMGSYSGWNSMSGWNNSSPQSVPPNISGGGQNTMGQNNQYYDRQITQESSNSNLNTIPYNVANNSMQQDEVKSNSQFGNASSVHNGRSATQTAQPKIDINVHKPKTEGQNKS